MQRLQTLTAILLLLIFFRPDVYAQSGGVVEKQSQNISEARLKSAKIVEELIDQFPTEFEIVSCRISLVGKDIKYQEHSLPDHTIGDLFGGIHYGHKIFLEYIQVRKKGSETKPSQFRPIELVVTE